MSSDSQLSETAEIGYPIRRFANGSVDRQLLQPATRRLREGEAMRKHSNSGGRQTNWTRAFLAFSGLGLSLALPGRGLAAGPAPGTVIGPDTVAQAEGFIPPEFLERYKKGEFQHPVALPKPGTLLMNPEFLAAGGENA